MVVASNHPTRKVFKEENLVLSTFQNPFTQEPSLVFGTALSDPAGTASALYGADAVLELAAADNRNFAQESKNHTGFSLCRPPRFGVQWCNQLTAVSTGVSYEYSSCEVDEGTDCC
jgi:hypothetical protein